MQVLTEIIRLLLKSVPDQRGSILKEQSTEYEIEPDLTGEDQEDSKDSFAQDLPLP